MVLGKITFCLWNSLWTYICSQLFGSIYNVPTGSKNYTSRNEKQNFEFLMFVTYSLFRRKQENHAITWWDVVLCHDETKVFIKQWLTLTLGDLSFCTWGGKWIGISLLKQTANKQNKQQIANTLRNRYHHTVMCTRQWKNWKRKRWLILMQSFQPRENF